MANKGGGIGGCRVNIKLKENFSPLHYVRGSLSATLEGWGEGFGGEWKENFSMSNFFSSKNICLQLFYQTVPKNMEYMAGKSIRFATVECL